MSVSRRCRSAAGLLAYVRACCRGRLPFAPPEKVGRGRGEAIFLTHGIRRRHPVASTVTGCHRRRTESLSGSQTTQGAMAREGARDVSGRWQRPICLSPLAVLPAPCPQLQPQARCYPESCCWAQGVRGWGGVPSLFEPLLPTQARMGACISAPPTPGATIEGTGHVKTGISAVAGNMVPTSHALSKCYQDSQGHSQAEVYL